MTFNRAQRAAFHGLTRGLKVDVTVSWDAPTGALTVRCDHRLWLIDHAGHTTRLLPLRGEVAA